MSEQSSNILCRGSAAVSGNATVSETWSVAAVAKYSWTGLGRSMVCLGVATMGRRETEIPPVV